MSVIGFICLVISLLFLYRSILSALILCHKKFILDEQNYIFLFYLSFVCFVVAISKNLIVGYVGVALTPIVLIIYFLIIRRRIYWIVDGVHTNLASYGNALIAYDEKYKDGYYLKNHISLRKVEGKIEVVFEDVSLEEKEQILKIFKKVAKNHANRFQGRQLIYLILNLLVFIVFFSLFFVYL